MQRRISDNITHLAWDKTLNRLVDLKEPKISEIFKNRPELFVDFGTYRMSAGRKKIGVDVRTADASGNLEPGTWKPHRNTQSSSVNFDGAARQLTSLDTLMIDAGGQIPTDQIWNLKNLYVDLLDADGNGLVSESDPAVLRSVLPTLKFDAIVRSNRMELGAALPYLLPSRVDTAASQGGTEPSNATWPTFHGGPVRNLARPIALGDRDRLEFEISNVVQITGYGALDQVAVAVWADLTIYERTNA